MRRALVLSMLVAGVSLLVVAPAPSYDQWAWLAWGEQVWTGALSTLDGPSFKPLPVAVSALLAPLGAVAPVLWVFLARAGAALAVVLAFRAGSRLSGGSRLAGVLAAVGVVLGGDFLGLAAAGWSEGILLALALGGAEVWRAGRPRWAVGCGLAAALVRVETWPFLLVAGVVLWRRRPQDRPLLVAVALLVPPAWVVPELVGSGQALRSASRALVPNPGQPGLSDAPALASLRAAVALPLWPLWTGVALAAWSAWRRRDRTAQALLAPAAVGLTWIGLVAAMAEAGFSGEPRYALPGAALVSVSGAAGLGLAARRLAAGAGTGLSVVPSRSGAGPPDGRRSRPGAEQAARGLSGAPSATPAGRRSRLVRAASAIVVLVMGVAAVPRIDASVEVRSAQAYQWRLQTDLAVAVTAVGGTDAALSCGTPFVGPLRGPLLARHLGVAKARIEPDQAPAAPGLVFRSALHAGETPAPVVPPGFDLVAKAGLWQVYADCDEPALVPAPGRADDVDQAGLVLQVDEDRARGRGRALAVGDDASHQNPPVGLGEGQGLGRQHPQRVEVGPDVLGGVHLGADTGGPQVGGGHFGVRHGGQAGRLGAGDHAGQRAGAGLGAGPGRPQRGQGRRPGWDCPTRAVPAPVPI